MSGTKRTDWHRYRGWALMDLPNGRYAAKGNRRVRVCGLHEDEHNGVAERFRAVVDGMEGGKS